jgi:hypothetical protein
MSYSSIKIQMFFWDEIKKHLPKFHGYFSIFLPTYVGR